MKKIITICLIALALSFQGISQSNESDKNSIVKHNTQVINSVIGELLSDEELNRPYEVSANHNNFLGKGMEMLKNNQDSTLLRITQLPNFSGVLIVDQDGSVTETMDISVISKKINEIQSQITASTLSTPTKVWESESFGDSTHIEWWYFKNKKGEDSKFGVTFTNGQITVLYFKV